MRKCLYINNFRGFSDTYIPLEDVSFLVGENSTGKTSVLSLLKLLSSPSFWFSPDFRDEDVGFGLFNDIVSAHSTQRTYFQVGLIEEYPGKGSSVRAHLFTFSDHRGLPRLTYLTSSRNGLKITLKVSNQSLGSCSSLPEGTSFDEVVAKIFPGWVNEHLDGNFKLKRILSNEESKSLFGKTRVTVDSVPVAVLLDLAQHSLTPGKKRRTLASRSFDLSSPDFGPDLVWIAPIRTKPKRTYDEFIARFSPEGEHTPYLIRRILGSKTEAKSFSALMQRVGKASGLFQTIQIKRLGHGATAPFEVQALIDGKALMIANVGYGVSQSLPVLVELLARPRNSWFAIQQPEVHLHPRAQAAIGDVLFEMAVKEKKRFVIETHSDFMMDRFRMNYKASSRTDLSSQILFFERSNMRNTVTAISIKPDGELPASQPKNYRNFFIKEELRLLGI
jgi:hypothetical protein